jgi:hypothetical protein
MAQTNEKPEIKAENAVRENIYDSLKKHFDLYRLEPLIEINNSEGNRVDIKVGKHNIKWLDTEEETKIKIDNDLFTLKDKTTLNIVWDNHDNVDFANYWDQIKLYKHHDKEYIGIRMQFSPCNGLACSVAYFLIYDVSSKSKSFFGTFRTDQNLVLYDFLNDDKIDYISKTFAGDAQGATPMEFIYELYSMEVNGQFKDQKDKSGLTYQIKHTTFPNDTAKVDRLTERWITKIKVVNTH